ncbi:TetR/AcrR family transcriptional regulator [Paracoccus sanguinis]|uniref:TetR/AcrR family transcriptional regulator n=1 Tax=Paracoccus sanguinis TaxID=1545044 RepID=UPI00068D0FD8|nr:TetR/AcrR family transcriptional regulator [Paracoccus sanguinis]
MNDGPRQARSTATLERILAAALIEFRLEGFRGAGIAAICKRAGISPGHLYHYFPGKEAIVAAIVERDRHRIRREIERLLSSPEPIKAIVSAITSDADIGDFGMDGVLSLEIYAEAARNPAIAQILQNFEREMRGEAVDMLTALRARGDVSVTVDLTVAAALMIALVDGMMVRRAVLDPHGDPEAFARPLERMLAGLLAGGDGQ